MPPQQQADSSSRRIRVKKSVSDANKQTRLNDEQFNRWFYNQEGITPERQGKNHPLYLAQKIVWDHLNPVKQRLRGKVNRLQQTSRAQQVTKKLPFKYRDE